MKIKEEITFIHLKYFIFSTLTPEQQEELKSEFIDIINNALRHNVVVAGAIPDAVIQWLQKTLASPSTLKKTNPQAYQYILYSCGILYLKYSTSGALTSEQHLELESEFIDIINNALRHNVVVAGAIPDVVIQWLQKTLASSSTPKKTIPQAYQYILSSCGILYLKYSTSGALTSEQHLELEREFIEIMNHALCYNGEEKQEIEGTARKLSLLFHPDKAHELVILWLENTLGNYSPADKAFSKAICFNIFSNRNLALQKKPASYTEIYEKPASYTEIYNDFTIEKLKEYCEMQKQRVSTKMQFQFYSDCIAMLDHVMKYHTNVDFSQCRAPASMAHKVLPVTITSTLGLFFVQELYVFYGICIVFNRLGHSMKKSTSLPIRLFGTAVEASMENALLAAATSFVKIHTQVTAICNSSHNRIIQDFDHIQQFIKKLLPYSEKKNILALTKYPFQSPCLEEVIAPLKSYLITTDQQSFKKVRCGQQKSDAVKKFFYNLILLESNKILRPREIWSLLENLAKTNVILNNAGAIQTALLETKERFLNAYKSELKPDKNRENQSMSMS